MKSVKYVKAAKYGYIAISLLLCAIGIILIAVPEISNNMICHLLGAVIITFGIVRVIGYCSRDLYQLAFQFDLAFGLLLIILGIVMLVKKCETVQLLNIVFGILILTDSLFKIQISIDAKSFGLKKWYLILIFGIVCGIYGMLLIINPIVNVQTKLLSLGLALIFEGCMNLEIGISAIKIADYQNFDTER